MAQMITIGRCFPKGSGNQPVTEVCFQRDVAEAAMSSIKVGKSIQATVFRLNKAGLADAGEVVPGKNIVYAYPSGDKAFNTLTINTQNLLMNFSRNRKITVIYLGDDPTNYVYQIKFAK